MNVSSYFALAVIATFVTIYLRQIKPEYGLFVSVGAVLILISGALPGLIVLISDIQSFAAPSGVSVDYIQPVIKIIGISYLTRIAADICKDAGEAAISSHVETIGKIAVTFIALPIVKDVFSLIIGLLE